MAKKDREVEVTIEKRRNKGIAKAHRERRRAEAELRQEAHDNLSLSAKIRRLDERLGKGIGAKRERMRLKKLIAGTYHRDLLRDNTQKEKPYNEP